MRAVVTRLFALWAIAMVFGLVRAEEADEGCTEPPTYFQYEESDLQALSERASYQRMTSRELEEIDELVEKLIRDNPSIGSNSARLYGYLYTAQREAAFLSYNTHGEFQGSLGPISSEVLRLFTALAPALKGDVYSTYLAAIVLEKLLERTDAEEAQMRDFPASESDLRLKYLPKSHYGMEMASWQPWLLRDPTEFLASLSPAQEDPFWKGQAEIVKRAVENNTKEQREMSEFWAGQHGDWLYIANRYMDSHDIPFPKRVFIRSILAEASVDADISLFFSKYTYIIERPAVVDPTIQMNVGMPKHPSYPAGHSTLSAMFVVMLSYYFPNEAAHWFQLAQEAGLSRIWAGLHFPVDHSQGLELGSELGEAIIHLPEAHWGCARKAS